MAEYPKVPNNPAATRAVVNVSSLNIADPLGFSCDYFNGELLVIEFLCLEVSILILFKTNK